MLLPAVQGYPLSRLGVMLLLAVQGYPLTRLGVLLLPAVQGYMSPAPRYYIVYGYPNCPWLPTAQDRRDAIECAQWVLCTLQKKMCGIDPNTDCLCLLNY